MTRRPVILSLFALALTGCSSMQLYVDDAYHWEDKTPSSPKTQTTPKSQSTPTTPTSSSSAPDKTPETTPAQTTPTLEFLNVQDTTVTVRINR